jgi:hypothetical protein
VTNFVTSFCEVFVMSFGKVFVTRFLGTINLFDLSTWFHPSLDHMSGTIASKRKRTAQEIANDSESDNEQMKKSRKDLVEWVEKFNRVGEIGDGMELEDNEMGVIVWSKDGKKMSCPFNPISFLLRHNDIDTTNHMHTYLKKEYGVRMSQFPEMLRQLALELLKGAEIALKAGIQNVPDGDEEDEDEEDEDEE